MINFGGVPAGSVLPVFFSSYAAATGASVTLTGLAVTDVEVYKGVSMTQRASDAGYTLIDPDGIDVDGVTGIHGFSIDTGDNTDASFYTVGAFFTVVVSAVTIDSQTVNFIAATFRLMAAETSAGVPKGDMSHFVGVAQTSGAIPAAVAGAAGGLAIAGSNAATTFATLTVTGATTLTGALTGTNASNDLRLGVAEREAIRDKVIEDTSFTGTCGGTPTATSIPTSAIAPATSVGDQLKGQILMFKFDTTTAALRGQKAAITASTSSATPTLTVEAGALTTAPVSGDTFTIG